MQQPTDQSVDQRKDVPGQYLDIALVAGQYKIYYLAIAFDLLTQSVTHAYTGGIKRYMGSHLSTIINLVVDKFRLKALKILYTFTW